MRTVCAWSHPVETLTNSESAKPPVDLTLALYTAILLSVSLTLLSNCPAAIIVTWGLGVTVHTSAISYETLIYYCIHSLARSSFL